MKNQMEKDIKKVFISERKLRRIIKKLGAEISRDYKGKNLLLISILKGSVVTMADLMRAIKIPCEIEFMVVSSYGSGTESTGTVQVIKDQIHPLEGYDVLLVEDILDTGNTLNFLRKHLIDRNPNSIRICTLIDKIGAKRCAEVHPDYVGTTVPNEFIVGYGLDFAEKYRNLPYIGVLKKEVYEKAAAEAAVRSAGKAAAAAESAAKPVSAGEVSGEPAAAGEVSGEPVAAGEVSGEPAAAEEK